MATALQTHITSRRLAFFSEQNARVLLSFLTLIVVTFIRRPDLLRWPTLLVEDATIFYNQQVVQGASAIFLPYNGYLHIVPRLIALLGTIVPTSWAAIVFVDSSVLIAAACGAIFSFDCYRTLIKSDFLRFFFPVLIYSASLIGSHMGNVTSLLWFLLMAAFLMLVIPADTASAMSRHTVIAIASAGLLISLSQPMCILLAPYALWKLKVFRQWSRLIPTALLLGMVIENGIFFAVTPYIHRAVRFSELGHQIMVAIANRVILCSFVGLRVAEHMDCSKRTATLTLICACICLAAVLLLKRRRNGIAILLAILYVMFVSVAIALSGRLEGSQFQSLCQTTNWEEERYFLPGGISLFYLLIAVLDTFPLPNLASSFLLLAIFVPALVNNFPIGRTHYNAHWRSHAKEINAWLSARRTCEPAAETDVLGHPGWLIVLPELRGCHGEVALDGVVLKDNAGYNYLADHGTKRPIPNEQTLKALGVNHARTMSAADLRKVPTGPPLPLIANRTIVNEATGEMFVLKDGRRQYIQNTSSLQALGLERPVTILSDALCNAFPLGRVLNAISNPAAIQIRNGPIFLFYNGTRYQIPDSQTLHDLNFQSAPTVFNEEDVNFLKQGGTLPTLRSSTIQDEATLQVYVLEDGMRRRVSDPNTFDALHRHDSIQVLSAPLINEIPEGPPLPLAKNAAQ